LLTLTALLLWRGKELKFSAHNSGSKIVWPQLLHVGTPKTWQQARQQKTTPNQLFHMPSPRLVPNTIFVLLRCFS
jgi:hypothetical protein